MDFCTALLASHKRQRWICFTTKLKGKCWPKAISGGWFCYPVRALYSGLMVWPYSSDGQRNPFPSYRIAAWDSVIADSLNGNFFFA